MASTSWCSGCSPSANSNWTGAVLILYFNPLTHTFTRIRESAFEATRRLRSCKGFPNSALWVPLWKMASRTQTSFRIGISTLFHDFFNKITFADSHRIRKARKSFLKPQNALVGGVITRQGVLSKNYIKYLQTNKECLGKSTFKGAPSVWSDFSSNLFIYEVYKCT